jgi:hypothetical protein
VEVEPNSTSSTNGYADPDQATDDSHLHEVLAGSWHASLPLQKI